LKLDLPIRANETRCQIIYTSFGDIDQFSIDAVAKYEESVIQAAKDGIKIRALLLCNPHNPLGKCYTLDALKAYFVLCQKYNIHLISDEIYALSVFEVEGLESTPFTSVLSIDPTGLLRTDQIHVLYGMSKVAPSHFKQFEPVRGLH
jgi:aspartate/methionine/tyrosine aminotransferase